MRGARKVQAVFDPTATTITVPIPVDALGANVTGGDRVHFHRCIPDVT